MLRYSVLLSLALPLCSYCQTYVGPPFHQPIPIIPAMAHVEGWSHGSIRANGIIIDLSMSPPSSLPSSSPVRGWSEGSGVVGSKPAQVFHFYIQYDNLNVTFGYDLLARPIKGTDKIKCTFSAFTDFGVADHRNRDITPVPLRAAPLVIKSGDVISIKELPLGEGKVAVVHYIRLTRTDLTRDSGQ